MEKLAELEDVVKLYGPLQALGPVTLDLPLGAVGILGPNGSGKSTMLRILLGLLPPTSGQVRVLGQDVFRDTADYQRRVGYVPEGDALFPGLTGVESVAYAGRLVGMRKADAIERAHQVLDFVELGEERYRLVQRFSTGMRQRLKIAQALVHDPELLVLDEPTEGVDPHVRTHILELVRSLVRDHGIHLLLSTHQLNDVERLASHAVVLQQGSVVVEGSIEDLKRPKKSAFMVRVNGDFAPLEAQLESAGVAFEHEAPNLRVELDDARQIMAHVRKAGLTIRHLAPTQRSLGEAFGEITGGNRHG